MRASQAPAQTTLIWILGTCYFFTRRRQPRPRLRCSCCSCDESQGRARAQDVRPHGADLPLGRLRLDVLRRVRCDPVRRRPARRARQGAVRRSLQDGPRSWHTRARVRLDARNRCAHTQQMHMHTRWRAQKLTTAMHLCAGPARGALTITAAPFIARVFARSAQRVAK